MVHVNTAGIVDFGEVVGVANQAAFRRMAAMRGEVDFLPNWNRVWSSVYDEEQTFREIIV